MGLASARPNYHDNYYNDYYYAIQSVAVASCSNASQKIYNNSCIAATLQLYNIIIIIAATIIIATTTDRDLLLRIELMVAHNRKLYT